MKPFLETTVTLEEIESRHGAIAFVATTLLIFGVRIYTFRKPLL